MNITKKTLKLRDLFLLLFFFFFFFFQFKQLRGVDTMALNPLYLIYVIQNSIFFNSMSVNQSFNDSVALCSLAICAQAHH